MSNKPLSFKDFNVVDYTFSHKTDPKYDPDGLLSYYAWQRQQSSSGADKLDEEEMFESWSDGFIDKFTQAVFNPKGNVLTLTWRNYEQWPKKYSVSAEDAKKIMNYDGQNRIRAINQLIKAGKLKKI